MKTLENISVAEIGCKYSKQCRNNKCIIRLKSAFGYPSSAAKADETTNPIAEEALEKAGTRPEDIIWKPKLQATVGSGLIQVSCKEGFVEDEEEI